MSTILFKNLKQIPTFWENWGGFSSRFLVYDVADDAFRACDRSAQRAKGCAAEMSTI
jgi:hypothetical protein